MPGAMTLVALSRRWSILLLILAFSAGLVGPAFAASVSNGHHTAAAVASQSDCHPLAIDLGQVAELDAEAAAALAEVDCALTHLGHAVLDRPAFYPMTAIPWAYPPTVADRSLGQVPGLEGDPPRPARST